MCSFVNTFYFNLIQFYSSCIRNDYIPNTDFSELIGLSNLQTLNLAYNKITELQTRIFENLKKIRLFMYFNQISSLQHDSFYGLCKSKRPRFKCKQSCDLI